MSTRSRIRPTCFLSALLVLALIVLGISPAQCPPENTPPTAPGVAIEPDPAYGDDMLTCSVVVESYDADGDEVTYAYAWYRDENPTGLTGETVPAEETAVGDDWECQVTPHDGNEAGPAGWDNVAIVGYAASGTYDLAPVISYYCAYGAVVLDYAQFTFVDDGATLFVEPAMEGLCNMTGPTASGGEIFASCFLPGGPTGCSSEYTLEGGFVEGDTWEGTFTVDFTGTMCFDCVYQQWMLTGTRAAE